MIKHNRKHLVSAEVDKLIAATKGGRNEARDRCLLILMFRHGLRVSEACGLKLSQVDIDSRVLHVQRLKKGLSTTTRSAWTRLRSSRHGSKSGRRSSLIRTPFSSASAEAP